MTDRNLGVRSGRVAELQRIRRKRTPRIDYSPGEAALAAMAHKRKQHWPGSRAATNSAVIDAILTEWAKLTGVAVLEVKRAPAPDMWHQYARAKEFGEQPGIAGRFAGARAGAYEFGGEEVSAAPAASSKSAQRVVCGAKRHRDGQPCQARSEPGKARCRFHGGRSTGPRTPEGRARAMANLKRGTPRGTEK